MSGQELTDCNCDNQIPLDNMFCESICVDCKAIYDKDGDFVCYQDERRG